MQIHVLTSALATISLLAAWAPAPVVAAPDLCGTPRSAPFVGAPCAAGQRSVQLVVCQNAASGKLMARSDRCRRAEIQLSLADIAEATGAVVPSDKLTTPEDEPVLGINKCGQASCLCTGTFCADLIDAGYCDDFHCAGDQCICIF